MCERDIDISKIVQTIPQLTGSVGDVEGALEGLTDGLSVGLLVWTPIHSQTAGGRLGALEGDVDG